jgi:hypothetical protein
MALLIAFGINQIIQIIVLLLFFPRILIHLYEGFGSVIYFLTVDKQLTEFSSW